jgi:fructose-1,6-bisphosphatase/inositol monophosphatase family enzyme
MIDRTLLTGASIPDLLRAAADTHIRPRFRALQTGETFEKSPGEVVTIADREAEVAIAAALANLTPGVPVIGEEATSEDPSLLLSLERGEACWLLDPLDGTPNFVAGKETYGCMLAYVEAGHALASWIWQPETGVLWHARQGEGAYRDGERMQVTDRDPGAVARGQVFTRFLPPDEREAIEAEPPFWDAVPLTMAAAFDYGALVEGAADFIRWGRLLPWDHAPGALVLSEAGGVARRMDGSPYFAGSTGIGLMAAATPAVWDTVRGRWP